MISTRIRTVLAAGVAAMAMHVAVAQTTLTIPDTTGRKGDTLLIPVTLSGIGANQLFSLQATVDFDVSDVVVLGFESGSALSTGGTASYFTTTRRLALAMTSPITSDGILLNLRIVLIGAPGSQTSLGLSSVLMNEGTPVPTIDPGSVRLRVITLSPKSPGVLSEADSLQFSATGDVVPPLTWTTSSSSVGTIDATGKFRGVAPGFVTVYVEDGEGKRDSSYSFTVAPLVIKSLTLWIPDTSRMQTLDISIPVRVTTVTGLGITSAQFRVTFNTGDLQYLGATTAGGVASTWGTPVVNTLTPGVLDFALAGSDTLTGAGTLLWISFRVPQSASGSSAIGLANATFNESIAPTLDGGTFTVIPAPLISVNTDRIVVLKGGMANVLSVTGGTAPFMYASSNPSIATVDQSTGQLTALNRGQVLILATDAQGFPGRSDTIRTYDFDAILSDTSMQLTDSVDVPLVIGDATGLGISSVELQIAYDTAKVRFREVIQAGTISDGYTTVTKDSGAVLRIAVAGVTPLTGSGILLKLRFSPNPPSSSDEISPLTLLSIAFNEPGQFTPQAHPVSGSIQIVFPNTPPTFTSELLSQTKSAGQLLTFTYAASDPDGDVVRYRSVTAPAGATLDSVTGAFSWSILVGDSGVHVIRTIATDGALADTTEATITVLGTTTGVGVGDVPTEFGLGQNYPNPFNPSTRIRFSIPASGWVIVAVFDHVGREVRRLVDSERNAGVHEATWNADGMSSGHYYVRLTTTGRDGMPLTATKKVVFLK